MGFIIVIPLVWVIILVVIGGVLGTYAIAYLAPLILLVEGGVGAVSIINKYRETPGYTTYRIGDDLYHEPSPEPQHLIHGLLFTVGVAILGAIVTFLLGKGGFVTKDGIFDFGRVVLTFYIFFFFFYVVFAAWFD